MPADVITGREPEFAAEKPGRMNSKERPGISRRLDRILDVIRSGDCLADIGTDHAYVPIAAVSEGLCRRAIACDIVPGPVERARANVEAAELSACIDVRQGDGLEPLGEDRPDRIVIAGMGGPLMARILTDGFEKIGPGTQLILSPQSEWMEFRTFLWTKGIGIRREEMVEEEGKFYLILDCEPETEPAEKELPPAHRLRYGDRKAYEPEKILLRERYIRKDLQVAETILKQLEQNDSPAAIRRRAELLKQTEDAKAALSEGEEA